MSYILDALRRADAERERDPARGIHAQPAAGVPARRRSPLPGWAWPAGALVIVAAAGVLAWTRFTMTDEAPAHLAAPTSSAADVVPVAATVPVAPVMPVAPPVPVAAAVLPPPPPVIVERVRVVTAPAANAPVAKASVPAPAPAAATATVATAQPAAAPATTAAPVVTAAPATAAAERIFAVTELPADVQKDLPKLAITGGVHSENAAQRMLVVGGKVVNEGAELAPGVVLDQIRPRTAVLKFRGFRYSVGY